MVEIKVIDGKLLRMKELHMRLEAMCKFVDCTEVGLGYMMGTLYCSEHLLTMDVAWEKEASK